MTLAPVDPERQVDPPEGGWGYLVCLALVTNFACSFSPMASYGMLYNDFYVEVGAGTTDITMVQACMFISMSISGIVTNVALKRFSHRQVGLFGAILISCSWLLNYFISSIHQMIFTSGFLAGTGTIFLTTVSFTSLNSYFVKKRVMVLSISQMIVGIYSMLFPLLLEQLMMNYGYRGSILIISAVVSNTIFAALCFHPVEWHAKRNPHYYKVCQGEPVELSDLQKSIPVESEDSVKDQILSRSSKVATPSNSRRSSNKNAVEEAQKGGRWKVLLEYMDITLLGDVVYLNITVGIALTFFSDIAFLTLYPLYLYSINTPTSQVASCLTLIAAADLLSRALLAIISKFHQFPSRDIYFAAVVSSVAAKLVLLHCHTYWSFMIVTFVIGVFRGPLQITYPLVYAEYLPDKFAAAYGLFIVFFGLTNTLAFPVVGYIRDVTGSYTIAFYIVNLISLLCIIPWTYEYWYFKRNKHNIKK